MHLFYTIYDELNFFYHFNFHFSYTILYSCNKFSWIRFFVVKFILFLSPSPLQRNETFRPARVDAIQSIHSSISFRIKFWIIKSSNGELNNTLTFLAQNVHRFCTFRTNFEPKLYADRHLSLIIVFKLYILRAQSMTHSQHHKRKKKMKKHILFYMPFKYIQNSNQSIVITWHTSLTISTITQCEFDLERSKWKQKNVRIIEWVIKNEWEIKIHANAKQSKTKRIMNHRFSLSNVEQFIVDINDMYSNLPHIGICWIYFRYLCCSRLLWFVSQVCVQNIKH